MVVLKLPMAEVIGLGLFSDCLGGVQVGQGQPFQWISNNNLHSHSAEHVFMPWLHAQKQNGDTFSPLISEWSQGDWRCYLAGHSGAQGQWDVYGSSYSQKHLLE